MEEIVTEINNPGGAKRRKEAAAKNIVRFGSTSTSPFLFPQLHTPMHANLESLSSTP